ncbi:hypothetical protein PILCRDRAFT_825161, partial [Piloderma croceum F 1598]
MSDSPVVTSHGKTSFAILSTVGYGHIVSPSCWLFGSINVVCRSNSPVAILSGLLYPQRFPVPTQV